MKKLGVQTSHWTVSLRSCTDKVLKSVAIEYQDSTAVDMTHFSSCWEKMYAKLLQFYIYIIFTLS